MVQIFQRESIFCNKISSGGSLFIKKLVPGGTNFGGSIFTMTVPILIRLLGEHKTYRGEKTDTQLLLPSGSFESVYIFRQPCLYALQGFSS